MRISKEIFLPMISVSPFNRKIKKVGIKYNAFNQEYSESVTEYSRNTFGIAVVSISERYESIIAIIPIKMIR